MIVTELEMTCSACPSQWEGRLEDGRFLYARYRWGYLSVTVADTLDLAIRGDGEILASKDIGGGLDGVMDTHTMLAEAGLTWRRDP